MVSSQEERAFLGAKAWIFSGSDAAVKRRSSTVLHRFDAILKGEWASRPLPRFVSNPHGLFSPHDIHFLAMM